MNVLWACYFRFAIVLDRTTDVSHTDLCAFFIHKWCFCRADSTPCVRLCAVLHMPVTNGDQQITRARPFIWRYVHLSMCSICLVKGEPLMYAKCEKLNLQHTEKPKPKNGSFTLNVTVFRVTDAQVPIIVRMNENRGNHFIRTRKHSKGKR